MGESHYLIQIALNEIGGAEYDEIHIANMYIETLEELLIAGISKERIVICNYSVLSQYATKNQGIIDIRFDMDMVMTGRMFGDVVYSDSICIGNTNVLLNRDYFRWGVLMRIAYQLKHDGVEGDMAELGVFRGDFSSVINRLFPERKLLLFDTFEGFSDEDILIQTELDNG